jgi:hypothetical protein
LLDLFLWLRCAGSRCDRRGRNGRRRGRGLGKGGERGKERVKEGVEDVREGGVAVLLEVGGEGEARGGVEGDH